MKKSVLYIGLAAILSMGLVSCTKEHAANQKVTVYANIEIQNGTTYAHQVGTPWVEPGFVATLAGEDVSDQIDIISNVDTDQSNVYTVEYCYTNIDGFTSSVSRTVVVYDIANAGDADITGSYDVSYIREDDVTYTGEKQKKITAGPAKGLFYVQDLVGGRYQDTAGYGASYAMKALILLNKDNSISILSKTDGTPWGDPVTDLGTSKYDPATGNVTLDWHWGGWNKKIYTTYAK